MKVRGILTSATCPSEASISTALNLLPLLSAYQLSICDPQKDATFLRKQTESQNIKDEENITIFFKADVVSLIPFDSWLTVALLLAQPFFKKLIFVFIHHGGF